MSTADEAHAHNGVSMASAVAALMSGVPLQGAEAAAAAGAGSFDGRASASASSPSANLAAYLASQGQAPAPAPAPVAPWQTEGFAPSTRSIVQAVRELRLQDVLWFLHQLDLQRNGAKQQPAAATASATPAANGAHNGAHSGAGAGAFPANNAPSTPMEAPSAAASVAALSTPAHAASSASAAGGLMSPYHSAVTSPTSAGTGTGGAPVAATLPPWLCAPSPLLSSLPSTALQLPSRGPYIMDTLFDALVGLQNQLQLTAIRETKANNRRRAKEEGVSQRLVDLLTPPFGPCTAGSGAASATSSSSSPSTPHSIASSSPSSEASLHLPSPASEDAYAILVALVSAVDLVGVKVLSKSACVDFLKVSDVPYPVRKEVPETDAVGAKSAPTSASASAGDNAPWTVTEEWKKRTRLLRRFGVVLDVENTRATDEDDEQTQGAGAQSNGHAHGLGLGWGADAASDADPDAEDFGPGVPPSSLSSEMVSPVILSCPPALSWFVHAPFTLPPASSADAGDDDDDDSSTSEAAQQARASMERYLQHSYLSLLDKRHLFLRLLTGVIGRVRTARAQSNAALVAKKGDMDARDSRIVSDVERFESETVAAVEAAAQARTHAAMESIKVEQLERDTSATLTAEWRAHREAVAIRGKRIVEREGKLLEHLYTEARERLLHVQAAGSESMRAVDESRARLRNANVLYERAAIALEGAQSKGVAVAQRAKLMESYVAAYETALKGARKSLKETHALVAQSRASTAALQVVELEVRGRNMSLLFGSGVVGVSNLFLKFFRCMTGAPDPNDPNPEVVWDPEPCAVTELCSPGPTRSPAAVGTAPSWRTVKIDLWKLCQAEYGRYFKVEVWDCDASVKQVASVVRSALEQAKVDQEAKAAAAATADSASPPTLNPDGTVQQANGGGGGGGSSGAPPSSVTLPSTTAIRYAYIGQSVLTLQHLLDAQARRAQEAAVSAPTGLLALPVINAERWASRHASAYVDSGTLIIASMKIHDA